MLKLNWKRKSKENKGFSLVELIVVVLIMAVLAVLLAPQVMQWVENARLSDDVSNYNQMFSTTKIALTNESAFNLVKNETTEDFFIRISPDGAKLYKGSTELTTGNALYDSIGTEDTSWIECKKRVIEGDYYEIKIEHGTAHVVAVVGKFPQASGTPWDIE